MELTDLERHLLNDFQHDLLLTPRPYAEMGERLGVDEQAVIDALERLRECGVVTRVGAVFRPHSVGASTLAALAVPPERLETVAGIVSAYRHVNHNYEREHDYNLWFVATAPDEGELCDVLEDIERATGLPVLALPLLEDYHIDLGFELRWT
ncbi:Lrp/AsnC family transcriptional regulator [Thioalkalivibrio nitratireducens]|nr:Lrp/AsnC family transcriptional regulator [Thioalkalivibrio nitratireducens]